MALERDQRTAQRCQLQIKPDGIIRVPCLDNLEPGKRHDETQNAWKVASLRLRRVRLVKAGSQHVVYPIHMCHSKTRRYHMRLGQYISIQPKVYALFYHKL